MLFRSIQGELPAAAKALFANAPKAAPTPAPAPAPAEEKPKPEKATLGGYVGLLGGNIKGQADANKRFLKKENFDPKLINLLRFVGPNRGTALTVTNLIPDPGHLSV